MEIMRNRLLEITRKIIPYVPELYKETKSVEACLIMQQLDYWFARYPDGFYKYMEPAAGSPGYIDGSSWVEELGFPRKVFVTAFEKIAVRYKSKSAFDKVVQANQDIFQGKFYCSFHDKLKKQTFYFRNHRVVDAFLDELMQSNTTKMVRGIQSTSVDLTKNQPGCYRTDEVAVTERQNLPLQENPRTAGTAVTERTNQPLQNGRISRWNVTAETAVTEQPKLPVDIHRINNRIKNKEETKDTHLQISQTYAEAVPALKDQLSLLSTQNFSLKEESDLKYLDDDFYRKIFSTLVEEGITVSYSHPSLKILFDQQIPISLLRAACHEAKKQLPGEHIGLRYVMGILKNWKAKQEQLDTQQAKQFVIQDKPKTEQEKSVAIENLNAWLDRLASYSSNNRSLISWAENVLEMHAEGMKYPEEVLDKAYEIIEKDKGRNHDKAVNDQ